MITSIEKDCEWNQIALRSFQTRLYPRLYPAWKKRLEPKKSLQDYKKTQDKSPVNNHTKNYTPHSQLTNTHEAQQYTKLYKDISK